MDKFTFILGVFLCFQISSVLTKNVFNLVQFSGCSLLILSNENNSAFDEVDIKTRLVEENQDNFFTYQIGTLVKKSQNNINRLQLLHCNVVILIDDENASKIINSIETSQLKYDTLLIITGKRNDFTSYSNLLKLKPISIFILEISKTDVIGNYYYFCFLCGNIKIPIDQPSFSISRNRFLFSEKWKQFTILVNSVNPTRDVERGIACNQRPLNYMDWLCK